MKHMPFVYDDGGRKAAGYRGSAGDCVVRAVAIASGKDYQYVYDVLSAGARADRPGKRRRAKASARDGVYVNRRWFKDQMRAWGFVWTPTMKIGQGTRVHLASGELPAGRLVVQVSKHYTAVINGTIRDTHNPQRDPEPIFGPVRTRTGWLQNQVVGQSGGRCVYGYWTFLPSDLT